MIFKKKIFLVEVIWESPLVNSIGKSPLNGRYIFWLTPWKKFCLQNFVLKSFAGKTIINAVIPWQDTFYFKWSSSIAKPRAKKIFERFKSNVWKLDRNVGEKWKHWQNKHEQTDRWQKNGNVMWRQIKSKLKTKF